MKRNKINSQRENPKPEITQPPSYPEPVTFPPEFVPEPEKVEPYPSQPEIKPGHLEPITEPDKENLTNIYNYYN